jgi:2-dehydrotetronate isomerase
MVAVAANLSTLFTEVDFLDRFDLAAEHGFTAVEFWYPYPYETAAIAERVQRNHQTILGFNTWCGDEAAGDWGLSADPDRIEEGRAAIDRALVVAAELDVKNVHVMSGIQPAGRTREECEQTYLNQLRYAADAAAAQGVTVLIEALSQKARPGYLVSTQGKADQLRHRSGRENVKLQFDVFHTQLSEGNLENLIRQHFDQIGHVQVASAPSRQEPDGGEIDYRYILSLLEDLGWTGYIAAEYLPRDTTAAGLHWITDFGLGY